MCDFYKDHNVLKIPRDALDNRKELQKLLESFLPDVIIHAAAYGNMNFQRDEDEIFQANVVKTWNLLQASKNVSYKAFINIGSSSEYGNKKHSMRETDIPETDTFYGVTKVAGTYLCRAFAKQYGKPIITVRPFSLYGEGESGFRFIPTIIRSCTTREEMYLDSFQKHDWTHVDDFVSGIDFLSSRAYELRGQVFNIGTEKQTTNQFIVDFIEKLWGSPIVVTKTVGKKRDYNVSNWKADMDKMRSLGWESKIELKQGLRKVYSYYKKIYEQQ